MSIAKEIRESLLVFADPEKASVLQGFFKTEKGAYGEGDKFVGIPVPKTRSVAKQYVYVAPEDVLPLLSDAVHECRLTGSFDLGAPNFLKVTNGVGSGFSICTCRIPIK